MTPLRSCCLSAARTTGLSFTIRHPRAQHLVWLRLTQFHSYRFSSGISSSIQSNSFPAVSAIPSCFSNMDTKAKEQYLADSPPTVVRLEIKQHFDALKDEKLKRYAHFISK